MVDFQKEPWKHPAAWKAHLVSRTRGYLCGVTSSVATCQCGWSACVRTDRGPNLQQLDEATFDHWRAVIAEAEAQAVPGMTITREDLLRERRWHNEGHVDFTQSFQNWYRHATWPRLTCIVEHPRGRRSKAQFSKKFFVDGVEVFNCTGLLERLNKPQLSVVSGSEAA